MGSLKVSNEVLVGIAITAFTFCLVMCACGALCMVYCITKKTDSAMEVFRERSRSRSRMNGGIDLTEVEVTDPSQGHQPITISSDDSDIASNIIDADQYATIIPSHKREVKVDLHRNDAYGLSLNN